MTDSRENHWRHFRCERATESFDWLIDWSTDWLTDWLIDWLTDWLIDWLIDWLTDWLTDWLIDWLTDWLIDWLIDWLPWLYKRGLFSDYVRSSEEDVSSWSCWCSEYQWLNLHIVLLTFPKVLTRRICLLIKSLFAWWSFPFFSWRWCVI